MKKVEAVSWKKRAKENEKRLAAGGTIQDEHMLAGKRLELDLLEREAAEVQQKHIELTSNATLKGHYDIVIVGTGPGGATLAYQLKDSGLRILLLERGDFIPLDQDNWNESAVLERNKYVNSEEWLDSMGRPFQPYNYYYVGGMTKMYGACLQRFREGDFEEIAHYGGVSPAWPLKYQDFEPYYAAAERIYTVHGEAGHDPLEPRRAQPFPYPKVPRVDKIEELAERLQHVGLHPYPLPVGLDLRSGGRCIYCGHCDGFPCHMLAKGDADLSCVRPAVDSGGVELLTRAYVRRLETDAAGKKVVHAEVERDGTQFTVKADLFVVSAGAVNTPALLLRSASSRHSAGLGNSSGLLGCNYMCHETSWVMFADPENSEMPKENFWKSLGVNDYYFSGGEDWPFPMGTFQLAGNQHGSMYKYVCDTYGPEEARRRIAKQMLPFFVISEDLPAIENRITLQGDFIKLSYQANNVVTHAKLTERVASKLRDAGYERVSIESAIGIYNGGGHHQCGTAVFGTDPRKSVLDLSCRSHDVENLYVVDGCFFPSSTATNPVLTIAANALRVADHLRERMKK